MNPIPQIYDTARRVVRTVIQSVPGVLVIAALYPSVVNAIGIPKDSNLGLWLAGSVVVVGGVAAAITRVMAIPGINAWLAKIRLAGHSGNLEAQDSWTRFVPVQQPVSSGEDASDGAH